MRLLGRGRIPIALLARFMEIIAGDGIDGTFCSTASGVQWTPDSVLLRTDAEPIRSWQTAGTLEVQQVHPCNRLGDR